MCKNEKMRQNPKSERFWKIEIFALGIFCYRPSTNQLSFHTEWSDIAKSGLYGSGITNDKKSRSAITQNSMEFEEL